MLYIVPAKLWARMTGRARSATEAKESSKVIDTTPRGNFTLVSESTSTAWRRYVTGPPLSSYTAKDMSVKPVVAEGRPAGDIENAPAAMLTSAHCKWTTTHSPDCT